jgi:outer membrane protein assembly factor BamD
VQAHRNDADIPYAQFRVCKALFQQINDTLLLPPQEERDQSTIIDAYRELVRFRKEYVQTKWDDEIDYMLRAVVGRLARHEIYVGRFYLRIDRFEAAVGRLQYAIRKYPGSGLEPEAIVLLGETYLKMKKNKEARDAFERLLVTYPESPFTVPAKSFLAEMDAQKK